MTLRDFLEVLPYIENCDVSDIKDYVTIAEELIVIMEKHFSNVSFEEYIAIFKEAQTNRLIAYNNISSRTGVRGHVSLTQAGYDYLKALNTP